MQYAFQVGQVIRAKRLSGAIPSIGTYQVLRLLPPGADDVPLYRIRSLHSGVEWVASQDLIELAHS